MTKVIQKAYIYSWKEVRQLVIYVKNKNAFNKLLLEHSLTQKELANKIGIGRTYLSAIINQHRAVGVKTARKMCNVLETSLNDIFLISLSTKVKQKELSVTS